MKEHIGLRYHHPDRGDIQELEEENPDEYNRVQTLLCRTKNDHKNRKIKETDQINMQLIHS